MADRTLVAAAEKARRANAPRTRTTVGAAMDALAAGRTQRDRRAMSDEDLLAELPPAIRRGLAGDMLSAEVNAERVRHREDVERQRDADRVRELEAAASIPTAFRDASLSDLSHLPDEVRPRYAMAVDAVRAALDPAATSARRTGPIVVLYGESGPGKTYIGCGIVREWCLALRPARFAESLTFLDAMLDVTRRRIGSKAALEPFVAPALLVLDETQQKPGWENQEIEFRRLVNERYANGRATLLITNDRQANLVHQLGSALYDRVADGGTEIGCSWGSLRGRL